MQLFLFWQIHILTVIVINVKFVLIVEKSVREEYITSSNSHHSKYWKTLNMIDVIYKYENIELIKEMWEGHIDEIDWIIFKLTKQMIFTNKNKQWIYFMEKSHAYILFTIRQLDTIILWIYYVNILSTNAKYNKINITTLFCIILSLAYLLS